MKYKKKFLFSNIGTGKHVEIGYRIVNRDSTHLCTWLWRACAHLTAAGRQMIQNTSGNIYIYIGIHSPPDGRGVLLHCIRDIPLGMSTYIRERDRSIQNIASRGLMLAITNGADLRPV